MLSTISAFDARKNFGELLNTVAYGNRTIVIKRRGIPLVEIRPIRKKKNISSLKNYTGTWAGEKGDRIADSISEFRQKFKPFRRISL